MEYWWGGRRRPLGFINARPPRLVFLFRCYIRVACSHQTNRCRVHLEAAWGERSHTRFDWHVLTSPNEPPKKKKQLHPDSHTVNQAGLKVPAVHFQVLFRLLSHLALSLFFFSHPLCLFFLSPSSGSVPTVPPGNVQAEPVNSTTVRFTWSAPSPQFINGINQGYKVSPAPFCRLVHSSGRRQKSTQSVQISLRLQQWWDVFLGGV